MRGPLTRSRRLRAFLFSDNPLLAERITSLLEAAKFYVEQRSLLTPVLSELVSANVAVVHLPEGQYDLKLLEPFAGLGKPVVVLLDTESDFGLEVLSLGVQDVLLLDELETIGRRLRYAVESFLSTNMMRAKGLPEASTTAEFTSAVRLLQSASAHLNQTLDPEPPVPDDGEDG